MIRLINVHTLQLASFDDGEVPAYAIASHRWQEDEVTLRDLNQRTHKDRKGFEKLVGLCKIVRTNWYGFEEVLGVQIQWLWIDACCIDQQNGAEVSETINRMFDLYAAAKICLAYLYDVAEDGPIEKSVWFERGWTLQELLSPSLVLFLDGTWQVRGHKLDSGSFAKPFTAKSRVHEVLGPPLVDLLAACTGIPVDVMENLADMEQRPCFDVFSWMQHRSTQRPEDEAYCLLGLFDVSMPLIYGERGQAKLRLMQQIEIKLTQRLKRSRKFKRDELSPAAHLQIEQQLEALSETISQVQYERRQRRLENRTRLAERFHTLNPFTMMLDRYNELSQTDIMEALRKRKAQSFWNPLDDMSVNDATS